MPPQIGGTENTLRIACDKADRAIDALRDDTRPQTLATALKETVALIRQVIDYYHQPATNERANP